MQHLPSHYQSGDNDGIYDVNEQEAAVLAWFNLVEGEHTFLAAPRHIRVGLQFDF